MTVIRIKTSTGWQDLQIGGQDSGIESENTFTMLSPFAHYSAGTSVYGSFKWTKWKNGLVLIRGLWMCSAGLTTASWMASDALPAPVDGAQPVLIGLALMSTTVQGMGRCEVKQDPADGNKWKLQYVNSWSFGSSSPSGATVMNWCAMESVYHWA